MENENNGVQGMPQGATPESEAQAAPEVAQQAAPEATQAAQATPQPQPTPVSGAVPPEKPQKKGNGLVKGLIIGGIIFVLVAAIAVAAIIYFVTRPKTIDISKYVDVTFDGADGYGTADVDIDDALLKDIKSAMKDKGTYSEHKFDKVLDSFYDYEVDPDSELSNGDKVKVKFDLSKDKFKDYGIVFKNTTVSKKVSGLKKIKKFDAFEDIELEYSGTSPEGYVYISGAPDGLYYEADKTEELSNGDEITVKVLSYWDDEDEYTSYAQEYGQIPEETEKTFTVEGLDKYINDLEKDADAIEEIQKKAAEDLKDNYFGWDIEYQESSIEGTYLGVNEDAGSWDDQNVLVYIYKVTVKDTEQNKTFDYYTTYSIKNIKINEDGELEDDDYLWFSTTDDEVTVGQTSSGSDLKFYGYSSVDEASKAIEKEYDDFELTSAFG